MRRAEDEEYNAEDAEIENEHEDEDEDGRTFRDHEVEENVEGLEEQRFVLLLILDEHAANVAVKKDDGLGQGIGAG